jgi:hypothetical protein
MLHHGRQQTVFAATEDLVSLVCSVIDYVTTHMEGYQFAFSTLFSPLS